MVYTKLSYQKYFLRYDASNTPAQHFGPKAKLAQITLCFGSNSHSIQLTVVKFAQISHFNVFSLLIKAECSIFIHIFHMHDFIIFNIIKTYYFEIIIKPYNMIKCHTLNYFVTRINMYRTSLDKIYPNIY